MSRMLRAVALGLGLATAQRFDQPAPFDPLDGALEWIKQHGKEVMDTTGHCMDAARMAGELQGKCGKVFDPEALASFAAWGLLEFLETVHKPLVQELMHSSLIRSAKDKAIASVQQKTHQGLDEFCGQPDCIAGLAAFDKEYGVCYAGTLCTALSSHLEYDKCQAALQEWLPQMFRNQQHSMCAQDGDYYCSEEDTRLLMQNPECFMKFKMPVTEKAMSCSQQCVEIWKKEEREHPKCMEILRRQTKEQYEIQLKMMRELVLASKDHSQPEIPEHFSTFDEVCLADAKRFVV